MTSNGRLEVYVGVGPTPYDPELLLDQEGYLEFVSHLIGGLGIMAGTVPTAGELDTLTDMIADMMDLWFMRLFSGNITPGSTTTLAALLAGEASFTGYSPAALTTWSSPTIDGTSAAITTSTQGQFTGTASGGTGNIYGYFLTNSGGTKLYGCERFAGAPLSEAQNVTLEVDATYSLITRF
jgi:hypothetical protein